MGTILTDYEEYASITKGVETRALIRKLLGLRGVAKRKRKEPLVADSAALQSDALMCELSPPLLSPEERGQGNSINARFHRILHG